MSLNTAAVKEISADASFIGDTFAVFVDKIEKTPCIISPDCGSRQPVLYTRTVTFKTVSLGSLAQPVLSACIDSRDLHENLTRKHEFGLNLV
jgi:hypothetical protein